MIAKRWLLLLVFVFASVTWTRDASAALTINPNPLAVAGVTVGSTGTATGTLSDSLPEIVDLSVDPACAGTFTVTPNTAVDLTTSKTITVGYTAAARGAITCTVNAVLAGTATPAGSFNIRGTGVAQELTIVTASPVDFGSVRVANATVLTSTKTIVLRNSGDPGFSLSITALALSGAHPGDYAITSPTTFPQTLAQNATLNVTVVFNPTASGTRTANLDVTTDDPVTATKTEMLTGVGTNAVINVTDVDFMTVTNLTTSTLPITVSNVATAPVGPLTVTSASITQASTWFSFAAGTGCTAGATTCTLTGITAPANKNVNIRCAPPLATSSGTQTATVTFVSDSDPTGSKDTATLSCTAGRPNMMLDMTALDFGSVLYGTTTATKTVTVSNLGNTNLTYTLSKVGTSAAQFNIAGCGVGSTCTVIPGVNQTFTVSFTSALPEGLKSAIVRVTNNDPDPGDNPTDIPVQGTTIAPDITPSSISLAFGNVEVGKVSTAQTLTVTNTGMSQLTLTNAAITASGTEYSVVSGTLGAQMTFLNPGQTASWDIVCNPQSFGARPAGQFRVTSNAVNVASGILNVPLSCTGQQGVLTIAPASFDFGGVRMGDTVTHNFTLTNTGNVAVNNITATISSTLLGFSITTPVFPVATLNPSANVTVTVKFLPVDATYGCVVASAGDCTITFSGGWGITPTTTTAALVVTGDGLTAGYDTSPAPPGTLDFGDLRYDTNKTMTYQVINTDSTAIQIQTMTITPTMAMTGEFTLVSYSHGASTFLCNPLCPAVSLAGGQTPNDRITVSVKVAPANRVAMLSATVNVHSDLTTNSDRQVLLVANSTTAAVTVTPATNVLDFGAVDRDLGPVTQTIRIANTGTGPLNLGAAVKAGTDPLRYALGASPAQVIAPAAFFDLMVTYTPTIDRPPGQFDMATVTFSLAGVCTMPSSCTGGPSTLTVMIQGRGIDRHINMPSAPVFPYTFRNPGDKAPVMPVTVINMGEAPLDLSAVMLTNSPIWEVVNPDPVIVPGFGTHDFNVKFAPTTAGKAPDGQMMIVNNDNGVGTVLVTLMGNGINRNVEMGPAVIDLGYTGIGIPVQLSQVAPGQLLHVASMDPSNTFKIHAITLTGSDRFTVDGAPTDADLAPSTTQQYDITFDPTAEGDFEATATLFLDTDPTAQSVVTIKGHAVFVDAHGGGGCSTGRESGGGGAVLVLGAMLLLRRRRRVALAALFVALLAPAASRADGPTRDIELSVFHPTPSTTGSGFQLQSPDVGADGDWVATALVSYATRPLVLGTVANDDVAISTRTTLEVGGAYAFLDRFEAGARMPLYFQAGDKIDSSMMFGVAPASGTARGDLTLHGKAKLVHTGMIAFGAGAALTLPTATADQFAGVSKPTGRVLGLATIAPIPRLTLSANLGAVLRATSHFANIDQGSGVAWGAGASFRALDAMWVGAEVFGELIPGGRHDRPAAGQVMGPSTMFSTIEILGGIHYSVDRRISLGLAIGHGLNSGLGAPALRGLFSLAFTPNASELPPIHTRPPHENGDRDGDGVADDDDKCPNEPEDKDMFDDGDGCPDPDNDNDGVADAQDKCPLDAEDRDGFQDDDGCPDKDNDGDGIADAQDKCPLDAEDKDGFQDLDGCPDPDNDGDGIPDGKDKCPADPETINGNQDDDGCPDRGDSLVVLSPDRLELLEAIQFNGTKISKSSSNVLGQIGATLRAHTEIMRLRITVHVQPTSNSDRDQELSDKRATAVREWLVAYGIPQARVEVRGFGGNKPLVPADQRGSAAINERLELIILERR